jgi:myo-inositol-1(or 4)-monophosphatase
MPLMRNERDTRRKETELFFLSRVATDAAMAPAALIRRSYGKALKVDSAVAHDLKLRLDRTSEEIVLASIRRRFPGHGVLSEEMGYIKGVDPFLWIVDPLDGTVNFYHRIPFFCTCVSCHRVEKGNGSRDELLLPDGRAIGDALVGAIYYPLGRELFVGILGHGAFLNGKSIRMNPITDVSQAIVLLSFGARDEAVAYMSRLVPRMAARAQMIRNLGSTGLDIAFVAAGRVGAFLQVGTNLWDFAAASMILEEAGGIVEVKQYAAGRWKIIASNRGIFSEVRKLSEGE